MLGLNLTGAGLCTRLASSRGGILEEKRRGNPGGSRKRYRHTLCSLALWPDHLKLIPKDWISEDGRRVRIPRVLPREPPPREWLAAPAELNDEEASAWLKEEHERRRPQPRRGRPRTPKTTVRLNHVAKLLIRLVENGDMASLQRMPHEDSDWRGTIKREEQVLRLEASALARPELTSAAKRTAWIVEALSRRGTETDPSTVRRLLRSGHKRREEFEKLAGNFRGEFPPDP